MEFLLYIQRWFCKESLFCSMRGETKGGRRDVTFNTDHKIDKRVKWVRVGFFWGGDRSSYLHNLFSKLVQNHFFRLWHTVHPDEIQKPVGFLLCQWARGQLWLHISLLDCNTGGLQHAYCYGKIKIQTRGFCHDDRRQISREFLRKIMCMRRPVICR